MADHFSQSSKLPLRLCTWLDVPCGSQLKSKQHRKLCSEPAQRNFGVGLESHCLAGQIATVRGVGSEPYAAGNLAWLQRSFGMLGKSGPPAARPVPSRPTCPIKELRRIPDGVR